MKEKRTSGLLARSAVGAALVAVGVALGASAQTEGAAVEPPTLEVKWFHVRFS